MMGHQEDWRTDNTTTDHMERKIEDLSSPRRPGHIRRDDQRIAALEHQPASTKRLLFDCKTACVKNTAVYFYILVHTSYLLTQ